MKQRAVCFLETQRNRFPGHQEPKVPGNQELHVSLKQRAVGFLETRRSRFPGHQELHEDGYGMRMRRGGGKDEDGEDEDGYGMRMGGG